MTKRNEKIIQAKSKMLEAEVELLEEAIADALHWDRPTDVAGPLKRIRQLAADIGNQFGLDEVMQKAD